MEYRMLGAEKERVSVIALGGWEFGKSDGFATADQKEVDAVVGAALDAGVTLIDTAQIYANGESETMLGKALAGKRERVFLATKFADSQNWEKPEILKRLDGSLQRLQTDHVDLYQMHTVKRNMSARDVDNMVEAFRDAIRQGKTRYAGISNFHREHLEKLPDDAIRLFLTNQVPYNLLWRLYDLQGATDYCRERRISLLAYSPLAVGLLTGAFTRERRPQFSALTRTRWLEGDAYEKAMAVVDELRLVAKECGHTMAQTALNWVLRREAVGSAIIGTRSVRHLQDDLGALGWRMDDTPAARLDRVSMEYQKSLDPNRQSIW